MSWLHVGPFNDIVTSGETELNEGFPMAKAIRVHANGGPEVLQWEEIDVGQPGEGQARIRHTAIGVNFIDIRSRTHSRCTVIWRPARPLAPS
jgi:NADPH:quinone reductase-like Zn-dependent oxidoreductase